MAFTKPVVDRRKWALGYLRGRIRGFARGNISLAMVQGASLLALRCGVSEAEINEVLERANLVWDPVSQLIIRAFGS
jgi:hypothetical protein